MMLLILLLCGIVCVSRYVYMYIHTYVCECVCVAVFWYDAVDHVAVWQYMCQQIRVYLNTHIRMRVCVCYCLLVWCC